MPAFDVHLKAATAALCLGVSTIPKRPRDAIASGWPIASVAGFALNSDPRSRWLAALTSFEGLGAGAEVDSHSSERSSLRWRIRQPITVFYFDGSNLNF